MSILNGDYSENTIENGHGGIYITNTQVGVTTQMYIESAVVSHNKASTGSAIYLNEITLSNDSYIRNTKFSNNESNKLGVVYLWFYGWTLEISDTNFENNTGADVILFISTEHNAESSCYT